ncbi:NADH-ubiquinone oxidoreductase chain 2 [Dendrobium catenatum]|uniref:NADH-ubiquinone oxidoreductase chain 2 n=1 Tax=Dendrobium catenatum TaxID=906689 RepID=A0A2I0VH92_9ASPA|nr:NADH-ubiquinone oxidoreductase chain 2 [Dendrobium catenatum]
MMANSKSLLTGSVNRSVNTSSIQFIDQLKGKGKSNPLLGLSLAICLFSMAGIPPLIGFFAKQMVLYSSTHGGYYFLSIIAILVSVISASYYLKILRVIYFDTPDQFTETVSTDNTRILSRYY